jgi:hypothetical protein
MIVLPCSVDIWRVSSRPSDRHLALEHEAIEIAALAHVIAAEGGARFDVDRLGEVEPNDFRARVIRQGRDGPSGA